MSDKKNADYKRLLDNLGCKAENFTDDRKLNKVRYYSHIGTRRLWQPMYLIISLGHNEQCEGEVTHSHFN